MQCFLLNNQNNNSSECAGTHPVNGYTRWDGVEVSDNADIYNMQKYSKGEIAFVIVDFYDFANWHFDKYDNTYDKIIKYVNNNAYWQQEAKQLVPYVLYIPIEFSFKEVWDILHPDTPLQELFDKYL